MTEPGSSSTLTLLMELLLRSYASGNVCLFCTVMIQLAESILEEDTTLGIAYLLALHEVCNGLSRRRVFKISHLQVSKEDIFQQ